MQFTAFLFGFGYGHADFLELLFVGAHQEVEGFYVFVPALLHCSVGVRVNVSGSECNERIAELFGAQAAKDRSTEVEGEALGRLFNGHFALEEAGVEEDAQELLEIVFRGEHGLLENVHHFGVERIG